jgi:hypothetical protein
VKQLQVLVMENDTRLTAMLEQFVKAKAKASSSRPWDLGEDPDANAKPQPPLLRHPRDKEECLTFLASGRSSVLVLKLGRNAEEKMALLSLVTHQYPDTGVIVVGEAMHASLAGLAWDLGASYVMILPQPQELLMEVVAGLLRP